MKGDMNESAKRNLFLTNTEDKCQPVYLNPDCEFVLKIYLNA